MVAGDEAVPSVLGYTGKGGVETTCGWVFKKEHLALSEVTGVLK